MAEIRPLRVIAAEIRDYWNPVHPYAAPYVNAMATMDSTNDPFGADPGKEIVLRFLVNAATWRGEAARRIKAELRAMVK